MSSSKGGDQLADLRGARVVLAVAVGVFVLQGWFFAGTNATWHEECSAHAAPPALRLTAANGSTRVSSICAEGARLVNTDQRPQVVLCAGGLAWPVLVTPYIVSVHYWPLQALRPLHRGDPVALRRTALCIGVLALVVVFFLVERIGGALRAAAAVATAAVAPSFVILHSLLVTFENAPPLLLALAALVVVRRPDLTRPLGAGRAAIAGALAASAVLANVKAVVVGVPLVAFALFESPTLRRTPRRAWLAVAGAAALVMLPIALVSLDEASGRFSFEVFRRLGIAASRLDPRILFAEILNGVLFATDIMAYGDVVSGRQSRLVPFTFVLAGSAFVYTATHFVFALRRRPHDRVAAGCGAIQLFFLVFVWLAYNQTPAGNYSPIICVQVVSIGCTLIAGGRWLARRLGNARLACAIMIVVALGSLPINMYRRGDPRVFQTISTNMTAVHALAAHLQRVPDGTIVVTNYNLTCVPDILTGRSSLSIHRELEGCGQAPDAEACEREVVGTVISLVPNARFLAPLHRTVVDKPSAWRALATIEEVARERGLRVREEGRFATGSGIEVLGLFAIEHDAKDLEAAK